MAEDLMMEDGEQSEGNENVIPDFPMDEGGGGASPQLKKILKLTFIIGTVALFIFLMIYISQWTYKLRNQKKVQVDTHEYRQPKKPKKSPLKTLALRPIRFNFKDPKTQKNVAFLQLEIALGYRGKTPQLQTEVEGRKLEFRDKILSLLSRKTFENLKGSEKLEIFKKEILNSINAVMMHGKIEELYMINFNIVPRQ